MHSAVLEAAGVLASTVASAVDLVVEDQES